MTTITVRQSDALPDVLARLRQAGEGPIALEIPPASSLFLTASEFRALRTAAERDGLDVSVATDDPLRQQLAAMFGLAIAPPSTATNRAPARRVQTPPTPARRVEAQSAPERKVEAQPVAAGQIQEPAAPASANGEAKTASQEAKPDKADAPAAIPPAVKVALAVERASEVEDEAPAQEREQRGQLLARLSAADRRVAIIAAAGLAVVLVVAYLLASLFLTRATVELTVRRQPIQGEVTYALLTSDSAPPGVDFAIAATPVAFDVTVEQSLQTTGVKTIGDATATGKIVLRNTTPQDVTIEAGTRFTSFEGIEFEFTDTVTIPAAKGDGAQPGQAEATVRSVEPGTVGNREIGMLTGRLRDGVFYSNRREPIAGGTDRTIPVVSEEDLESLRRQATEAILAEARSRSAEDGQIIEPGSVAPGEITFDFDRAAGEEATTVSVRASARVTAMMVDEMAIRDAIAGVLANGAPEGYEIDPATIRWSAADPSASDDDAPRYRARVEAQARALVSEDERRAIAEAVAGKDESDAIAYLQSLPYVDSATIRSSPGWLPGRIPSSAGRIEVRTR